MPFRTIGVHDAAALTIIADYPNMPEPAYENLVNTLTSDAQAMAPRVRESSLRLRSNPAITLDGDDTVAFVRSVAASAGRL